MIQGSRIGIIVHLWVLAMATGSSLVEADQAVVVRRWSAQTLFHPFTFCGGGKTQLENYVQQQMLVNLQIRFCGICSIFSLSPMVCISYLVNGQPGLLVERPQRCRPRLNGLVYEV